METRRGEFQIATMDSNLSLIIIMNSSENICQQTVGSGVFVRRVEREEAEPQQMEVGRVSPSASYSVFLCL